MVQGAIDMAASNAIDMHLARAVRELEMAQRAKHASARLAHYNLADMHRRAAARASASE